MIERYTDALFTWVDLSSPTPDEAREVMEKYNIPPQLLGDLSGPVPRSTAHLAENALKITLDFPVVKRRDIEGAHEIKFLITKKTLITVRYEDISALHTFAKEFEVVSTLHKSHKNTDGGTLFVALMGTLYENLSTKLDYVESKFITIEEGMVEGRERRMVFDISNTGQSLITFRQILFSHKEVLDIAIPMGEKLFGKDFKTQSAALISHLQHLLRRVNTLSASLQELRATNDSLLSAKQNEIVKTLTILAFVTYPLSLIAAVFGMNTDYTPIVDGRYGFWIIFGMMGVAGAALFSYFKFRNWI